MRPDAVLSDWADTRVRPYNRPRAGASPRDEKRRRAAALQRLRLLDTGARAFSLSGRVVVYGMGRAAARQRLRLLDNHTP
ncbi:MAG: hypothetical protein FWH21_05590 [Kiritimatiellaeota bacterium]|nr:hypothetical protein [Kiritimatiellota bacterium]